MAQEPGWYDDPDGLPMLRWWDGNRWTVDVTTSRQAAPPGAAETTLSQPAITGDGDVTPGPTWQPAPDIVTPEPAQEEPQIAPASLPQTPAGGAAPPGGQPVQDELQDLPQVTPPYRRNSNATASKAWGLTVTAVISMGVALGLVTVFMSSGGEEPEITAPDGGGQSVQTSAEPRLLRGGALGYQEMRGSWFQQKYIYGIPLHARNGQQITLADTKKHGQWYASAYIGQVPKRLVKPTDGQTARAIAREMAAALLPAKRKLASSDDEHTWVDDIDATRLHQRYRYRLKTDSGTIKGEYVTVIVVDTGNRFPSAWLSRVPLHEAKLNAQLERAIDTIRVY